MSFTTVNGFFDTVIYIPFFLKKSSFTLYHFDREFFVLQIGCGKMKIESSDGTVTVFLDGEIDHHSAKAIREEIDNEIQTAEAKLLILDFRDVTFMDSSGIGLVMGRYRLMSMNSGHVEVINTSPQIYKVMRIAGLDRLASIEKTAKAQ